MQHGPRQLQQLVAELRSEIGHAASIALGVQQQEMLSQTLRRVQEELWVDHDWEHLQTEIDDPIPTGVRFHVFPAGMSFERAVTAYVRDSARWVPVRYGIAPENYNIHDSDAGALSSPIQAWQQRATGQYEVWPVPDRDQTLRFVGTAALTPMVSSSDLSTLDGTLIVLFAAAEILTRQDAKDAQIKMQRASRYLNRIRMLQSTHKRKITSLTGTTYYRARPGIDYIPPR